MMNTINKKFMSLFMGLIVLGSFNAVNASESTRKKVKACLENAAQSLVAQYGRYVPAMPTMPSLPSTETVKESVKHVSTKILANGKEFFSLSQPLSSLASRTASITIAYFMLTYLQDLCDQVPSLKRYKKIFKNNFARIVSAVSAAFVADQMSSTQLKYLMGSLATFYLIVRYFGLKPVLKRLKAKQEELKENFHHVDFSNNGNIAIIKQKDESIQNLTNNIRALVPKYNAKHQELVSAQDEIAVLNAKIVALEQQKLLMQNHQRALNQDLQDELKAFSEEKSALEKQNLLLSSNDTNSLNHDLKVQLTLFAAEKISLEHKIQQLEEEKNTLANTLTGLNGEWTVLEATIARTVEDSELSDSKFTTPEYTPFTSPNASAHNSDQSDQDAISSDEDYQDALTDQEDNN